MNPFFLSQIKPYSLVIAVILLATLVQVLAPESIELLRYQGESIRQGEWWRLITANFCHSNWNHWALNMSGLLLIDYLFQPQVKQSQRCALLVFCILFNTLALHLTMDIGWYLGLSGALHGYLLGCALLASPKAGWIGYAVIVGVVVKLISELNWEINSATAEFIEANVLEEAHLAGAVAGVIFYLANLGYNLVNKKGA